MIATVYPSHCSGSVHIPPSKSMAHRAIICAALADGVSHLTNIDFSDDIRATIDGMRQLGAQIDTGADCVSIRGIRGFDQLNSQVIDCQESGSTLRFFIPLFFVVSGAKIDVMAVFDQPLLLVTFILLLLIVRAAPVFVALSAGKKARAELCVHERLTVSLYCTTALPIIVAVTTVAVDAGAMPAGTAGTLVAAGAVTVFLMPLLASVVDRFYSHRESCCHRDDEREREPKGGFEPQPAGSPDPADHRR